MNMKELERYIATQCVYETIYQDSEGRAILVMTMLDALGMVNTLMEAEREACAALCDDLDDDSIEGFAGWQYGEAIRKRGAP